MMMNFLNFVSYIMITTFIFLNIVTAVVVESVTVVCMKQQNEATK